MINGVTLVSRICSNRPGAYIAIASAQRNVFSSVNWKLGILGETNEKIVDRNDISTPFPLFPHRAREHDSPHTRGRARPAVCGRKQGEGGVGRLITTSTPPNPVPPRASYRRPEIGKDLTFTNVSFCSVLAANLCSPYMENGLATSRRAIDRSA